MLRWFGPSVLLHILFVFFCCAGVFDVTPLHAKSTALYERLNQESPEEFVHLHLLHNVDLSTGTLSLKASDALLLGADPISLVRTYENPASTDIGVDAKKLSLGGGWWIPLDPAWRMAQQSTTLTTIDIPTLNPRVIRYSLKLAEKKISDTTRVLQLSSREGPLCRYSFVRASKDEPFQLREVQKTGEDPTFYTYQPHPLTKQPLLATITQGGVLHSRYTYDTKGRVIELWHPLGETETLVLALSCRYEETSNGMCVHCEDAEGAMWRYHFSKKQQLTAIDTLLHATVLRTERFTWQNDHLIEYSIHNGKNAIAKRYFSYTEEGKCASSVLVGNLTGMGANTFSMDSQEGTETITTMYTYDGLGRLIKKQTEEITYLFEYHGASSLTKAEYTLKNGTPIQRSFTSYDQEGNCLRSIHDDGSSMDPNSLTGVTKRAIISQTVYTGPKGKGLPQCIDALHLDVETNEEKLDHTWICLYDTQGHLIQRQECNEKGELFTAISYAYDAQGRLVVEEQLEGPTYTYIHSPRCIQILCCQKSGSSSATYSYDFAGHLLREEKESPTGSTSSKYRYSPFGWRVEQEDTLGNITTFQYDVLGRKILEKRAAILGPNDEARTPRLEWDYDLLDRPLRYVDPDGYATTISCTLYGHPYHKEYPDGTVEDMRYSPSGTLLHTRDRTGQEKIAPPNTSFSHASADPSYTDTNSTPPPLLASTKREKVRNSLGQWVYQDHRTEEGLVKISTYDALHQLIAHEEHDIHGHVRLHKKRYSCSGRPILEQWFHDKNANASVYTIQRAYGPMGRLEKVIEGVGTDRERQMLYHYDKEGRLDCITKPNGCQIHYTYDQHGHIATMHASDRTLSYAYRYDEKNNPIAIDNLLDGTTLKRYYDEEGRLLEEKLPSGHRFVYQYDAQGRLQDLTLPDGTHTCYAYDANGLQSITRQDTSGTTRYTQQLIRNKETGQLEATELPHQLGEVSYARDSAGKRNGLSSPFFEQTFVFAADSPTTLASEQRKDPAGTYSTTYRHDAWQQLVEEHSEGSEASQTQIYDYDALGNRIARNQKPSQFHANNDLDHTSNTHYTYDQNGNRVRSEAPLGIFLYEYDALNRLILIEQPEQSRTTYSYDPLHRRNKRTSWVWDSTKQTWQPQEQEIFLYQGNLEVGTVDQEGKTVLRILMPDTPSESGAMVAIEHQGHLYIPLQDLHGSATVLLHAETRQPVEYYRRDAFGQEQLYQVKDNSEHALVDASQVINPWRMEGKRHDAESGLIYYGQRFYDPSTGMWLTKDPLGLCDGPQDSLFVQNNPLHRTDLHGLFSLSKLWNTLSEYTLVTVDALHQTADNVLNFLLHDHKIISTLQRDLMFVRGMCARLISEPILAACDFYTTQPNSGVYGNGELSNSIRFSYVNGILNTEAGVFRTLKQLSDLHGGVNIHYTYRPTEGWTLDLLKAILVLKGYTSPTAISLVGLWRELIEEMGGVEGGGTIIHYAHSLGSAETNSAQSILTSAEKRKLRIFTFGSPILIQDTGFASVTNYVSRLDMVSLFDPYRYFAGLIGRKETNIVFIGSYWGLPLLDHYIDHKNYMRVLRGLGKFFTHGVHDCQAT